MPETLDVQFASARKEMTEQIALHASFVSERTGKETLAERVMEAVAAVPRHEFVPAQLKSFAYFDQPLPIGYGKTISQPFIVALMTDLLDIQSDDIVLEIGTGLGYQAAILGNLARKVYTVEIIEGLAQEAHSRLAKQGYTNVDVITGDGSSGWREYAPYDKIIATAAPELIPTPLFQQLKSNGRMVIPAGLEDAQQLMLVEKNSDGRVNTQELLPVRFSSLVVGQPTGLDLTCPSAKPS
jgi:protein-L-isoaspartate(D-aspartate) O-methyltransferase